MTVTYKLLSRYVRSKYVLRTSIGILKVYLVTPFQVLRNYNVDYIREIPQRRHSINSSKEKPYMALDGELFFSSLMVRYCLFEFLPQYPFYSPVLAKFKISEIKLKRKFLRQFMPSTSDDSHAGSRSAKVNRKWNAVRNYYQFRFLLRWLISSHYFWSANKLVNM